MVYFDAANEESYSGMVDEVAKKEGRLDILVNNFGATDVKTDLDVVNGDTDDFFRFQERCRIAGIEVPIEAGIMPVLNRSSIERMVSLCGASMPRKLTRILARSGDHPAALREAGMAYAIDQIADLMAAGVDGIHLYTMNNPAVAKQISASIASIRNV